MIAGYPHYPTWRIDDEYAGRTMTETVENVTVHRVRQFVPQPPSPVGRVRMEASFGVRSALAYRSSPDVIVCVSPALLSTAMVIARAKGQRHRPAIGIWVQDLYSKGVVETGAMSGLPARAAARFESTVLRSADGISVIHDSFQDLLVRDLGVDRGRIQVIRNWTHVAPFRLADRAQSRLRFGWKPDEVVVLHAGNMGAKQGLENVVDAARIADRTSAPVKFVLLGDGNQRARLENMGNDVPTLQFIRPLPDEEFLTALACADILLVNERPGVAQMAVPSKLTSYFSSGIPVIAATAPDGITAGEIAASGGGTVVPAGNPEALVAQACSLAADPERGARMAAAGQKFCSDSLSERTAIDSYESWITDLARARPRVRRVATEGLRPQ